MNENVLEVKHLFKRFPGVIASNDVTMEIKRNSIHAFVGENGAGKSTLCKMLTGVYKPDEGQIFFNGKEVKFKKVSESMKAGINMVYQERNLVGYMTGAENICLGHEPKKKGVVDTRTIKQRAESIREKLGIDVPLDVPVEKLGAGEQQLIEIMRAFYMNPQLLILDEPTASLGESEVDSFLKFICQLRDNLGISIAFISHKLEEVYQICDYITVFTEGHSVLTAKASELPMDDCIAAMIKKGKIDPINIVESRTADSEKVIEVDKLSFDGKERSVNFNIYSGEMVGFYGLVGSGRTETAEVLFGIRKTDAPISYTFDGKTITSSDPYTMIHKGMVLTPEIRSRGIFGGLNLSDNICSLFWDVLSKKGTGKVMFDKVAEFTQKVLTKNKVKYSNVGQSMQQLSGGNMQKIIIGRSVEVQNLKLLIVDEPTAGMDLGAKHDIYLKLRDLVEKDKKAVLFISSELEELLNTCDRLYVFFDGDIVKEFKRGECTKEEIIAAAMRGGAVNVH